MCARSQAPHATPGQRLDGNAPCFTNYSFVFQNASLTNHSGMYKLNGKIITIIHSEYFKW